MQTKGFIRVITVLLILICLFYLSFSFVTSKYEQNAAEYAAKMSGTTESANDLYKTYNKQYLDSIANEKVYLGWQTFKEVRAKELGLGLDLKGGMNVTLQISVPDILRALSSNNPDAEFNRALALTDSLHANEKDYVSAFCNEYEKIAPDGSLAQIFRNVQSVKTTMSNNEVKGKLLDEVNSMVDNSYNVLRNRIDGFGVVAPNIQKLESTGRILLELPGVKEPERVDDLLRKTANLEFYETYTLQDVQGALQALSNAYGKAETPAAETAAADTTAVAANDSTKVAEPVKAEPAAVAKSLADMLWSAGPRGGAAIGLVSVNDTAAVNAILRSPQAKSILPSNLKPRWSVKAEDSRNMFYTLVALKTGAQGKAALNGDVVVDASSDLDQSGMSKGYEVSMVMNDEGSRQWARITQQNIGKSIAIVLDEQVYSFPNVNTAIEGGRSQITGNFTVEEAKDLANVLKSGKMVAAVKVVSESVIGPSMGRESMNRGIMSFVVALVLLVIFMFVVYGWGPGIVANIGLVLNLFFTLGILASFQAVLTLPGIAGIVLALGMAVDANVLIFERTKEELRAGKNTKSAVADGYSNAFSAIFDSNLTSVITGIILFVTGSGPIKGFATTLVIGIACSFFTAVFATRLIMERLLTTKAFANMTFETSICKNLFKGANFDFIGSRKKGLVVVAAIVVVFAALLGIRGLNKGIDFSGGHNYVVAFDKQISTEDLKEKLLATKLGEGNCNLSVITVSDIQANNGDASAADFIHKVRISTNYGVNNPDEAAVDQEIMDILYQTLTPEFNSKITKDEFGLSDAARGVVQSEKVGPAIASDMTREAIYAVIFSLIAMALYILVRFRNVAFSLGALAAVAFTSFAIIGVYALYGIFPFQMEIDQTFIAAILTVIGYQVNDTVVVFDRIRETRTLYPKMDLQTAFNNSLNSTLSRTIMTSLSTLLVLVCIFALGGSSIRSFIFAMSLGVIVGTFASLFIATPAAYALTGRQARKNAK